MTTVGDIGSRSLGRAGPFYAGGAIPAKQRQDLSELGLNDGDDRHEHRAIYRRANPTTLERRSPRYHRAPKPVQKRCLQRYVACEPYYTLVSQSRPRRLLLPGEAQSSSFQDLGEPLKKVVYASTR